MIAEINVNSFFSAHGYTNEKYRQHIFPLSLIGLSTNTFAVISENCNINTISSCMFCRKLHIYAAFGFIFIHSNAKTIVMITVKKI